MAEINKNNLPETQMNTGTQEDVPVSSVSEPVQNVETTNIEAPEPVEVQTETIETPEVATETITPATIEATPVIEETTIEPNINVEVPQETVKIEESTKTPKTQPVWKVETAQDIKTQEITNEGLTNDLNEKKKSQVMQEFQDMVQSWATIEEIGQFWLKNKEFSTDINNVLRSNFKNLENTQYFWKYSTMSNNEMYEAYQNWDIVIWSDKYNLLPDEKKVSFNRYVEQKRVANSLNKTNFDSSSKVIDLSKLESAAPKMFNSSVRENYQRKLNDPRISELQSQLTTNQWQIEDIDDRIADLEDDILKASPWVSSAILWSEVRKRTRDLLRQKTSLLRQRQLYLSEYDGLKSDAENELKLSMYEDEKARQDYQTQLSLYETRRQEQFQLWLAQTQRQQQLEDREFTLKTQLQAEQRQNSFTIQMKELDQRLKAENPNWIYETDRDWNMLYVVKGKATKVRDADWQVVWVTQKKWEYNDTVQKNTDWTYSIFRTYNDWRKPEMFNYGIDWNSSYNTQMWVYDAIANIDSKPWRYFNWQTGKLQCWEAVNRYLKQVWIDDIRVWNSYESKKDIINNNIPQVGWLAVWNPVPEWEFWEFGHIWVVTWYNPDRGEVEITDWNKNGNWEKNTYTIPVSQVLNSDWGFRHLEGWEESLWLTSADIATFNNSTFKPQDIDNEEDRQKYQSFLNEKARVYNNPQAEMSEILEFSRWGKPLTDTSIKALEKFDSALNQIWEIQEQIQDLDTWPIIWRLKNINPYDTDAQTLKAQLTALIPNLARGVYGEVGVLTDNDVRLYSQTIPNLTSTSDTNDAVLAMTLKVVAGWYKRQLQSLAASWKDVSWFEWLYQNLNWQVEAIENRLWISWNLSTIDSLESEFNSWENTPSWVSESQSDYSNILWF